MSIELDTKVGNKVISEKLKGMLNDLRSNTRAIFDSVDEIKEQARIEGFEEFETNLLLKSYLKEFLTKSQLRYILHDKPITQSQKNLTNETHNIMQLDENKILEDNNIPSDIPPPDYKLVVSEEHLNEVTQQQQLDQHDLKTDTPRFDAYKQDYAIEDLKSQLDTSKENVELLTLRNKELEEKYKQLEAKTRVSPSNSIPSLQGNNLRTKVVVSQLFREILQLKGSKMIYANILIDVAQNKYVRLEPV